MFIQVVTHLLLERQSVQTHCIYSITGEIDFIADVTKFEDVITGY